MKPIIWNKSILVGLFAITAAAPSAQLQIVWQHQGGNQAVAFSPDNSLLASGGSGTALWDAQTGMLVRTLSARFDDSRSVAFSPNGSYLVGGSSSFNQNLNLWRVSDGLLVAGRVTAHENGVNSVKFSPNGQTIASGGMTATANFWGSPALGLLSTVPSGKRTFSVSFSPDGSKLVTGGQHGVFVWDVATGALLRSLDASGTYVTSVSFSPNGLMIAAAYDVTDQYGQGVDPAIRVWRVSDGALLHKLVAPDTIGYLSLAFSPDSQFIASGSDGGAYPSYHGQFRVWRLKNGTLAQEVVETDIGGIGMGAVMSVAYSPSGKFLAYTRLDGLMTVARNPFPTMASPRP